ncbi:MAG: hypothetical protein M1824_004788 [Vezdaea acicularis]|nr:MAG: hypothetical protein M1824_004788 [Vezdaea acicularis]
METSNEKIALGAEETSAPHSKSSISERSIESANVDGAFKYLESHSTAVADAEAHHAYTKALRRKIDFRIVPIMFCCYTMQFIDKVLINYAAVMGLNKDLKLKGNNFTNAATAFFIAYLIAEIPNGYAIQRLSPSKWLGGNVVLWGIATACTAATHNYHSLLAARIFLGIFEASIAPSLMIISSNWYTRQEQAPRFSLWYCGLGLGQIIGGVISWAFQHVSPHAHYAGWRIMFIVLGLVTVVIGLTTILVLPDNPMVARWLSEEQKVAVIKHVSLNQTGMKNIHFKFSHVLEILMDPQIWLLTIITMLISVSSGVVTTYSATLIKGFGYTSPHAALLNTPSGAVSILSTLLVGYGIRYTSHRWAWLVGCCIPSIIGGGLMSFLPARGHRAGLLAGIYLVNCVVATLVILYQWTAANCAGQTKRVVASALVSAAFSVGNIIGPQTFQARDAPNYRPAKIAVLATQAAGAFVTVVLFLYYVWANKRRDRAGDAGRTGEQIEGQDERRQWANLTDKENVTFRYVY